MAGALRKWVEHDQGVEYKGKRMRDARIRAARRLHHRLRRNGPGVFFDLQQAIVKSNTGGTDDFTKAGFGTPKAVLNAMHYTTASGTIEADASGQIGMSDGTVDGSNTFTDEDGVPTSNSQRHFRATGSVKVVIPSTNIVQSSAAMSNITDGCRYTWSSSNAPNDLVLNNLMFGGANLQADVGVTEVGISNNASQSIVTGFQPDVVLLISSAVGFSQFAQADGRIVFGFCDSNLNQGSLRWLSSDASVVGNIQSEINDERIATEFRPQDGDVEELEMTSINVDGFTWTARTPDSTWSSPRIWIALKLDNSTDVKVGTLDLPTEIGVHTISTVGFKPRLVIQLSSMLTAYNTRTRQDSLFGLSFIKDDIQVSGGSASQDGETDMSAFSGMDNKAIYFPNPVDGTSQWEGDFDSFASNGYAIDYTKVPGGSAVKGLYAAFK